VSTVRRHSRVLTDLPPELRREVDRLLLEPGVTYDDIREFLAGRGYDISRSSIGRYGKEYLESYQRLKIAIDQAKCMKAEAGDGLALEEAVANLALQQCLEGLTRGTIQVADVPKILGEIARIQSSSVARERHKAQLRAQILAEAEQKAAEAVDAATGGGRRKLTAEEFRQILRESYGA